MDSFTSLLKLHPRKKKTHDFTMKLLYKHLRRFENINEFVSLFPQNRVLICQYEKFSKDLNSMLNQIENRFNISISNHEREKITKYFSKEASILRSKKYKSFAQFDPITGIHGHHFSQSNEPLKELLPPGLYKKVMLILNKIDYPLTRK